MNLQKLKHILDERVEQYNHIDFINNDPIWIPHQFSQKEDIEISGFLISCLAWGNRISIINSGKRLLQLMNDQPYEFIMHYKSPKNLYPFVHRTFNAIDLDFFFRSLQKLYQEGGLEQSFQINPQISGMKGRLLQFRTQFFNTVHEKRSEKHISNPLTGSACKRLHMFLRWMVRKDDKGVDFGIWKSISMKDLYIPLDVHTGNIARKLGLLTRTKNDWAALEELQKNLIAMDPDDPAKYDFALFNMGVNQEL
jgi:uncharacterized protein (TIGR02757 family)